jgi:hypothetical protein
MIDGPVKNVFGVLTDAHGMSSALLNPQSIFHRCRASAETPATDIPKGAEVFSLFCRP